jgi:hypothetical protein
MKKKKTGILKMKTSISEIKKIVESLTSRFEKLEEYQGLKTKLMNYNTETIIKKINKKE